MVEVYRDYPAKLLLFGEHTVLKGSSSLAIPLVTYSMSWVAKEGDHPIWLSGYINYLNEYCSDFLDLKKLEHWAKDHTIASNIPIGYGLGSSGALTAAVFDICGKIETDDLLNELQNHLGYMESFFHGQSSGFDPLVSYLNSPILRSEKNIRKVDKDNLKLECNCYLLDSGSQRSGKEMINRFLENYDSFKPEMMLLSQKNDEAIAAILNPDSKYTMETIKSISQLQFEYLPFMITDDLKDLWLSGIEKNEFYMKICGAGGGGYYFLYSENEIVQLDNYKLEKIII